jgi:ABC-type multidrug transport system ATPase subunit
MTVLEHLCFLARVRGVQEIEHNADAVIKAVGLQAFSSWMAATFSGGNKRKLSLGIALIGNPIVLLLDEPSSGMDVVAKRLMWKNLAAVVAGRYLLLTTHSIEEADAPADRVGIMAQNAGDGYE